MITTAGTVLAALLVPPVQTFMAMAGRRLIGLARAIGRLLRTSVPLWVLLVIVGIAGRRRAVSPTAPLAVPLEELMAAAEPERVAAEPFALDELEDAIIKLLARRDGVPGRLQEFSDATGAARL